MHVFLILALRFTADSTYFRLWLKRDHLYQLKTLFDVIYVLAPRKLLKCTATRVMSNCVNHACPVTYHKVTGHTTWLSSDFAVCPFQALNARFTQETSAR